MSPQTLQLESTQVLDFRPFKAWRYNPDKVSIQKSIAPPYDVIKPEKQDRLYADSEHNCIRLILNKKELADNDETNSYSRARDFFKTWRSEGALMRDEEPSYYLYRQTYVHPLTRKKISRLALIGRVKLEPFEKGVIVPHEKTLSGPRRDRMKLIETVQSNFSSIFGLYEDPENKIPPILKSLSSSAPLFEVEDEDATSHALWVVSDAKTKDELANLLKDKTIYIADGHHRYETALEYSKKIREKTGVADDEVLGSDFVMMTLVEFYDEGLILMPTHRMLKSLLGLDGGRAIEVLYEDFKVETVPSEQLEERVEKSPEKVTFGLLTQGGGSFLLTLKDIHVTKQKMVEGKPDIWYTLDVNVLSHYLFSRLWNIPEQEWESLLTFTHSAKEAIDAVNKEETHTAFILKTPEIHMLQRMGEVSERMPQKTTYFYPKIASGLVFYEHNQS